MGIADRYHIAMLPGHHLVPEAQPGTTMLRQFGRETRDYHTERPLTWFNRWGPKKQSCNERSECLSKRVDRETIGFQHRGRELHLEADHKPCFCTPAPCIRDLAARRLVAKQKKYRLSSSSPNPAGGASIKRQHVCSGGGSKHLIRHTNNVLIGRSRRV